MFQLDNVKDSVNTCNSMLLSADQAVWNQEICIIQMMQKKFLYRSLNATKKIFPIKDLKKLMVTVRLAEAMEKMKKH
jgi:hypothetical protein